MLAQIGPPPPLRPGTHEQSLFFGVGIIIVILSSYSWCAVRSRRMPKIDGCLGFLLLATIVFVLLSLLGVFAD